MSRFTESTTSSAQHESHVSAAERRRRTARRRSIHGPTLLLLTASLLSVNSAAVGQEKPPGDSGNEAGKATASLSDFPAMRVPPAEPAGSLADSPEVRELYDAALEALEDGKPRRAIDKLDQALELADENYYEVFHLMARAKFSLKRFGEARTAADFAVRLRNGAADTHYLLGRLYRRRDDLERAIGHFRNATLAAEREVNNANISAAFFELGECLMETGYTQAAAESFQQFDERIFDSHPEHRNHERIAAALKRYPRGMIGVRTELLKKLGRTDDVVRAAEWAAGSRPEDDYLARMHIRALLDARRYAEAFEASSSVLKAAADLNDSYVGLAVEAAVGAKRLEYWVDELAAGLSADSKSGLAFSVARHLDAAGAAEAAIKLWRALAAQDPKDAARTWSLAASLRAAGRLRETVEALVAYVRGNPESVEVPRQQFAAWMRPFDASDELLGLVEAFSDDATRDFATDFILGSLAAAAGHESVAVRLLGACLEKRPAFNPARMAWGEMLLTDYRWEGAKEQAAAVLDAAPKHAAAHFLMARARTGLDENDEADKSYESAVRQAPKESAYALGFAGHHWRLYEWLRAQAGLLRAQRSPDAQEMVRSADRRRLGAQRYYREAVSLDPTNAEAAEGLVSSYLWSGKFDIARARLEGAEQSGLPDDALRRMRTLIEFFARPRSDEMLAELKRQFERYPDDVATGRKLAEAYEARRLVDEAHAVVSRVRKTAPNDDGLMRLAARIHVLRLEYEQAAGLFEEQLRRYPRRKTTLIAMAALYHNDLRMEAARAALVRLQALDLSERERRQYRRAVLETWFQVGDFDAALKYLDDWIAEEPNDEGLFGERINTLQLAGRHDEAVSATKSWVDNAADATQRNERLESYAAVCSTAGKHKLAATAYRELIDAGLSAPQLVLKLANTLMKDDRTDDALKTLDEMLPPLAAASPQVRWLRARCDAKAGRVDNAVNALETMLDEPALKASRFNLHTTRQRLILVLIDDGKYDRAIEFCEGWLSASDDGDGPVKVALLDLSRQVLQSADRTDEYIRVMGQLLELTPHDAGVNNDLGYTLVDRGERLEQAIEMIRKAAAAQPLNSNFLDSLGWAYYKSSDFSHARKYLRRSLRVLNGEDPVVRDHLADADHRLGDVDSARSNWLKSLDLIEAEENDSPLLGRAELTASVRAKLEALERGNEPETAPLGGGGK